MGATTALRNFLIIPNDHKASHLTCLDQNTPASCHAVTRCHAVITPHSGPRHYNALPYPNLHKNHIYADTKVSKATVDDNDHYDGVDIKRLIS